MTSLRPRPLGALLALVAFGATAQADPISYRVDYDPALPGVNVLFEASGGARGEALYSLDGTLEGTIDPGADYDPRYTTTQDLELFGTLAARSLTGGADLELDLRVVFQHDGLTDLALGGIDYALSDGRSGEFSLGPGQTDFDYVRFDLESQEGLYGLPPGNELGIDLRTQPVPEPASAALGLLGLGCGAIAARRRED